VARSRSDAEAEALIPVADFAEIGQEFAVLSLYVSLFALLRFRRRLN